jgi:hypothetical protein
VNPPIGLLLERAHPRPEDQLELEQWHAEVRLPALRAVAGGAAVRLAPRESADTARVIVVDVIGRGVAEALASARAGLDPALVSRFDVEQFGYELIFHAGRNERPPEARSLVVAQTAIRPEWEAEYNAWYNTEHVSGLVQVPGCYRGRRFRDAERPHCYVALYDIEHPTVIEVEAHVALRNTPWAYRILPRFKREFVRYCWITEVLGAES